MIIVDGPEARIALTEGILECVVQHGCPYIQEGLHGRPVPAHLLRLVHALGHDLIDCALYERRRDRLSSPTPSRVGHQRISVALEVAQQLADVSLEATDAGHVAHGLALRPATQGSDLAPAPRPAPMPQAPLRAFQVANRVVGEGRVSRACAEATGRLQYVLEAHGSVPPVQHDRGTRQRLALQPPQPGTAVAQYGRWHVRLYPGRHERLPERRGRGRRAVTGEGEAVLDATSVDDLARDHLEVALRLVPAAHVATVEPDHDGAGRRRYGELRKLGGVLLHDVLADPQRPVPDRAGVL